MNILLRNEDNYSMLIHSSHELLGLRDQVRVFTSAIEDTSKCGVGPDYEPKSL